MKENSTRLDIHEHRGLVFQYFKERFIPLVYHDELFVDFVIYFYEHYSFKEGDKHTAYIRMKTHNFLSANSKKFHRKNHHQEATEDAIELQAQHPDFLDNMTAPEEEGLSEHEMKIYAQELFEGLEAEVQEWLLSKADGTGRGGLDDYFARLAEEEGKTRQAIDKRVRGKLKRHLKGLGE